MTYDDVFGNFQCVLDFDESIPSAINNDVAGIHIKFSCIVTYISTSTSSIEP